VDWRQAHAAIRALKDASALLAAAQKFNLHPGFMDVLIPA
jgi:hypothetical protein